MTRIIAAVMHKSHLSMRVNSDGISAKFDPVNFEVVDMARPHEVLIPTATNDGRIRSPPDVAL